MTTNDPMTRRAFSLIELIAVVAVIAVAMTFVALNIGALTPTTRLTSAARYVSSMIGQARDEAVILGYPVGIGYDLDEGDVWLDVPVQVLEDPKGEDAEHGRIRVKIQHLHKEVTIQSVALDANTVYTAGRVVLDFGPLGTGPGQIVHLHSDAAGDGGQDCWLQVNPLTGEVEMTYSADEAFERRPEPPKFEDLTDADFPR